MKHVIAGLFVIGMAFSAGACSGGGKCEKAIDKAMGFAKEMMAAMSGMAGDKADEMKAEMEKQMAEGRTKALEQCKAQLEKDKEGTEKILDCIIAANAITDLEKCEGARDFMKMK